MKKINIQNTDKIQAVLDEVQGRCSVRIIEVKDIRREIDLFEKWLSARMKKADWKGVKFSVDVNGQTFPGSYKGNPESTHFSVEFCSSGWFVTAIYRDSTATSDRPEIKLQEAHKSAMFEFAQADHRAWDCSIAA